MSIKAIILIDDNGYKIGWKVNSNSNTQLKDGCIIKIDGKFYKVGKENTIEAY